MNDKQKVPLNVGWLSENDLLTKAAGMLGYELGPANEESIIVTRHKDAKPADYPSVYPFYMMWDENLMFTVAQLLELGFEPGEFKYCECCKKLQVDCDRDVAESMDVLRDLGALGYDQMHQDLSDD